MPEPSATPSPDEDDATPELPVNNEGGEDPALSDDDDECLEVQVEGAYVVHMCVHSGQQNNS